MMKDLEWWQQDSLGGDLENCLSHANSVNSSSLRYHDEVECCRDLFDALNNLWSGYRRSTNELASSDHRAFTDMLIKGIPQPRQEWLCTIASAQEFARFEPRILNHDTLRMSPLYKPNQQIPSSLYTKAALKHRELANAMDRCKETPSNDTQTALLKKLATMLYVVRSNIAHGEKTPFGPDFKKVERDRHVCCYTRPVLEELLQAILDHPSRRLAVYGSLAPGKANYPVLAGIPGVWQEGFVRGELHDIGSLLALRWRPGGEKIPVKVFMSDALDKQKWSQLDYFEGIRYRRILVPIKMLTGATVVANLYEVQSA